MRQRSKIAGMIFFLVLLIGSVFVIGLFLLKSKDDVPADTNMELSNAEEDETEVEKWQEGVVHYNGKQYLYNSGIKTYLIMGIDKTGKVEKAKDGISGGQSDALFLLVEDTTKDTLSVVAINRNTMTMVDVYDREGNSLGKEKLQICLQYGYGDGMRTSCLRSVETVSNLFYQLPISGYMALYMDAIPLFNDAVGGITLQVMDDLENPNLGVSLKKGETITLTGPEAYTYVRYRDINEFDSASGRLERQQQYIMALISQMSAGIKNDKVSVTGIQKLIEDYMVSNIDFLRLVENMEDYNLQDVKMYSLKGETYMLGEHEAFYVDDTALYEMILEVFYEEVTN